MTIFMLGSEGTGMRGLAYLLEQKGKKIIRHDDAFNTSPLLPGEMNLIVYSDAVPVNHPLRLEAKKKNIPAIPYQEALGQFAQDYATIAVTGTHGKSSTTAFLAHILIEAGLDPTVLIGAQVPAWGNQNAWAGKGEYFVVEADEYRDHFLTLRPAHIIITSIEHDHPDYFPSLEAVKKSYDRFTSQLAPGGSILRWDEIAVAHDISAPLPGAHMRTNAALAVAMAEKLGVPRAQAIASLKSFSGLGRRLEELGLYNGLLLVSDYGHHPTEIATTLEGAREKYKKREIVTIFEAHTLERLKTFFSEFATALSKADSVLLVPVFVPKGRENETAEAAQKLEELKNILLVAGDVAVKNIASYEDLPAALQAINPSSVAIGFTAGLLDAKLRQLIVTVLQ